MPLTRRDCLALLAASPAAAMQRRNDVPEQKRLSSVWPATKLASALKPRNAWNPYPRASQRDAWQALPEKIRAEVLERGNQLLPGEWPSLRASQFLEYRREGNRSRYEASRNQRRDRLSALVLAECMDGKGRFLDEIANGIWLTCEESWWGVPAHMGAQKRGTGLPDVTEPIIDLFAAETGAQLAWIDYLLGHTLDKVSPLIRDRIALEINRRVLQPYEAREDFGWMGFASKSAVNNWNPWINSNVLACTLAMENKPERRAALAAKILRSVDRFLDGYHPDGGCDEGPGYWGRAGASLFDNLELLDSATNGAASYWDMPLVQEIGRYIYRVHIADEWFVNFADAPAKTGIAADLVCRYGERIHDPHMQSLAAHFAQRDGRTRGDSLGRALPAIFHATTLAKVTPRQPLVAEAWLPGIQVMTARYREGSKEGMYVAAQGGHNAESHNHNDVGNFVCFANGEPLLIDVGVETYSAKTFSSKRYEIWTMQSAYHNCPTINGVMQSPGRDFEARNVAFKKGASAVELSMDIAAAYPADAKVESWQRTIRLDRAANELVIRDNARLRQLGEITLNLMTPSDKNVKRLHWEGPGVECKVDEVKVEDSRLRNAWGDRLYRIRLVSAKAPANASWTLRVKPA
ncbi:MAG: heparinase II/III family protein [Acidobacteria bacterium]|nr:heparinase II/III family protein [Acidobacteriota bacterium]